MQICGCYLPANVSKKHSKQFKYWSSAKFNLAFTMPTYTKMRTARCLLRSS